MSEDRFIDTGERLVEALLVVPPRRGLYPLGRGVTWVPPRVWIEEQHRDQLVMTEHPVEQGTVVTDHAFMRPSEVTIRLGWRRETQEAMSSLYAGIIALQSNRVLFDLWTGKRKYINMLAQQIAVTTDEKTANVLMAVISCRQVLMAKSQTTLVPADPNKAGESDKTTSTTEQGAQQLKTGDNFNPSGTPASVLAPRGSAQALIDAGGT